MEPSSAGEQIQMANLEMVPVYIFPKFTKRSSSVVIGYANFQSPLKRVRKIVNGETTSAISVNVMVSSLSKQAIQMTAPCLAHHRKHALLK